jgi:hypothetical protein
MAYVCTIFRVSHLVPMFTDTEGKLARDIYTHTQPAYLTLLHEKLIFGAFAKLRKSDY